MNDVDSEKRICRNAFVILHQKLAGSRALHRKGAPLHPRLKKQRQCGPVVYTDYKRAMTPRLLARVHTQKRVLTVRTFMHANYQRRLILCIVQRNSETSR